jgi:hypothetical protein
VSNVAFRFDIDERTVRRHYSFARECINDHMEQLFIDERVGRQALLEREP